MKNKYKSICDFMDSEVQLYNEYGDAYWYTDDEYDDYIVDYEDSEYIVDYKYLPDEYEIPRYYDKRGKKHDEYFWVSRVDMNSIYGKEALRQKRINRILGYEKSDYIPTFGDILSINSIIPLSQK